MSIVNHSPSDFSRVDWSHTISVSKSPVYVVNVTSVSEEERLSIDIFDDANTVVRALSSPGPDIANPETVIVLT